MKSLVIIVELRKPRPGEDEKGLYGKCITDGQLVSRVFIDQRRSPKSRINTFFHEVAHAFLHWRGRVHGQTAEKVAYAVGKAAEKAYKEAFNAKK